MLLRKENQEPIPKKIMGKMAKSYTCFDIQRILQAYDRGTGSKSERIKKQSLLRRLAQLEREEHVTAAHRLDILRGDVDPQSHIRYQELDVQGNHRPSAYPLGLDPQRWFDYRQLAAAMKEQGLPSDVVQISSTAVDGAPKPCRNCNRFLPELHLPSSVGSSCQHASSVWCRTCVAAFIDAKIKANDYKHISCPIEGCGSSLNRSDIKHLVTRDVFKQ